MPSDNIFGNQKPPLEDSIGPVIVRAKIGPYDSRTYVKGQTEVGMDTLTITVSEPLTSTQSWEHLIRFSKPNKDGTCPEYGVQPVVPGAAPVVSADGKTFTIMVSKSSNTPVKNDCVYITVDGTYADKLGNYPPKHGEKLDGREPPLTVVIRGHPPVAGVTGNPQVFNLINNNNPGAPGSLTDPNKPILWFPPVGFAEQSAGGTRQFDESRNLPALNGVSTGDDPAKSAQDLPHNLSTVQVVSLGEYLCWVTIYDHTGNFVRSFAQSFGYHGELYNNARIVKGGMVSYLAWDLKDSRGQRAGQGVYIWKMLFKFKDNKTKIEFTRTGVLRTDLTVSP